VNTAGAAALVDAPALIVATRGLPGSGKTTWALAELARLRALGVRAGRVSRDDVRATLGLAPGRTTAAEEDEVTAVQHAWIGGLIAAGVRVVLVDDTNLNPAHVTALADLAGGLGAGFEIRDLRHVPVATCIAHDDSRTGAAHLGAERILAIATGAGLAEARDLPAEAGQTSGGRKLRRLALQVELDTSGDGGRQRALIAQLGRIECPGGQMADDDDV
jgi:predicted kinase